MTEDTNRTDEHEPAGGEALEATPDQPTDPPELRRIRREAGNLRSRLRQVETELESARAAHLQEVEQLRKQLTDAQTTMANREATYKQQNARHMVESAARDLGMPDPAAAWMLLPPSALEFDDSGAPTNVAKALEALLQVHPILAGGNPTNVTNPARSSGAPSLSRQALANMTPQEINANWEAISQQLAKGDVK